MSIEKLEEIVSTDIKKYQYGEIVNIIYFRAEVIDTFKHQSDQIADLRQELAKKEDAIDVDDIKEVKNING